MDGRPPQRQSPPFSGFNPVFWEHHKGSRAFIHTRDGASFKGTVVDAGSAGLFLTDATEFERAIGDLVIPAGNVSWCLDLGTFEAPIEPALCPACALRPQGPSGLCDVCHPEGLIIRYAANDRASRRERTAAWEDRAAEAWRAVEAARAARHRQLKRMRPRKIPPRGTDPWKIAIDANHQISVALNKVEWRSRDHVKVALEPVREALRQLAWGPREDPPPKGK